jgi:hypothetical protein
MASALVAPSSRAPPRLRLIFEVGDRGALAQMVAEPGAVAARRWEIDFEEQVQSPGQRVLPAREARWGPQPGSVEQTSEQLCPARAAIGVIQAHEGRGQPEPFVFLHLPAQLYLRQRRLIPVANQLVILSRLFNAGQVVPQVPVPVSRVKNGREVCSQLISRERQVRVMKHICHKPTVGILTG